MSVTTILAPPLASPALAAPAAATGQFVPFQDPPLIIDTACSLGLQPLYSGNQQTYDLSSATAFVPWDTEDDSVCSATGEEARPAPSGLPASGIAAVTLAVTVTNHSTSSRGYLAVFPNRVDDSPEARGPDTELITFGADTEVSQQITVQTSSPARIRFFAALTGDGEDNNTQVIDRSDDARIDVQVSVVGYFAPTSVVGGSTFHPVDNLRIANSSCTIPEDFNNLGNTHGWATNLALSAIPSETGCSANQDEVIPDSSELPITAVVLSVTVTPNSYASSGQLKINGGLNDLPLKTDVSIDGDREILQVTVAVDSVSDDPGEQLYFTYENHPSNLAVVQLALDVEGYYAADSADEYVPMNPSHVADSSCTGTELSPFTSTTPQNVTLADLSDPPTRYARYPDCAAGTDVTIPDGISTLIVSATVDATDLGNVCGTGGTSPCTGTLTLYPQGGGVPAGVHLSFESAGVATAVVAVAPGTGSYEGNVSFRVTGLPGGSPAPSINVRAELLGAFTSGSSNQNEGDLFVPMDKSPTIADSTTSCLLSSALTGTNAATVQITGQSTCSTSETLPSSIDAVVVGVTAIPSSGISSLIDLDVYPADVTPDTHATKVIVDHNRKTSRQVTVRLARSGGNAGAFKIKPSGSSSIPSGQSVGLRVSVQGYYQRGTTDGARFRPLFPVRIADTSITDESGNYCGTDGTGNEFNLEIYSAAALTGRVVGSACEAAGMSGLPTEGVAAVVLNVIDSPSIYTGTVKVYKDGLTGSDIPAEVLQFKGWATGYPLRVASTQVVVVPDSTGDVHVKASTTFGSMKFELVGYYVDDSVSTLGYRYAPLERPARIARAFNGCAFPSTVGPFTARGAFHQQSIALSNAVEVDDSSCPTVSPLGDSGLPGSNIAAAVLDVTAQVEPYQSNGYLSLYPNDQPAPSSTAADAISPVLGMTVPSETATEGQDIRVANQLNVIPGAAGEVGIQGNFATLDVDNEMDFEIDAVGWFVGSSPMIETVAGLGGPDTTSLIGDEDPAVTKDLYAPAGVSVDPYGQLLVAMPEAQVVVRIDHGEQLSILVGDEDSTCTQTDWDSTNQCGDGGPATEALLNAPAAAVAGPTLVDGGSNEYRDTIIADSGDCAIRRMRETHVAPSATHSGMVDTEVTTLAGDGPNNCNFAGTNGTDPSAARLNHPRGVVLDDIGNIVIADTDNCIIRVISGAPNGTSQWGVTMNNGLIYTIAGTAGSCGYSTADEGDLATSSILDHPEGIALDPAGNLLIADTDNCTVRIVPGADSTQWGIQMTTGDIHTIAGTPDSCGYSGDGGPAESAQLDHPVGITVDPSGTLAIADTDNCRVRGVQGGTFGPRNNDMTPIIRTIAGTGALDEDPLTCDQGARRGLARMVSIYPTGVAASGSGDIYVADGNLEATEAIHNNLIRRISGLSAAAPVIPAVAEDPEVQPMPVSSGDQARQSSYGNANTGHASNYRGYRSNWAAGDANFSMQLPDGRVLWIYADSYFNHVDGLVHSNDTTTPPHHDRDHGACKPSDFMTAVTCDAPLNHHFVHNQMVIQDSPDSATRHNVFSSQFFNPGYQSDDFGWTGTMFAQTEWNPVEDFYWPSAPYIGFSDSASCVGSSGTGPVQCLQVLLYHEVTDTSGLPTEVGVELASIPLSELGVNDAGAAGGAGYFVEDVVDTDTDDDVSYTNLLGLGSATEGDIAYLMRERAVGVCESNAATQAQRDIDNAAHENSPGISIGASAFWDPDAGATMIYGGGRCDQGVRNLETSLYVARALSGTNGDGSASRDLSDFGNWNATSQVGGQFYVCEPGPPVDCTTPRSTGGPWLPITDYDNTDTNHEDWLFPLQLENGDPVGTAGCAQSAVRFGGGYRVIASATCFLDIHLMTAASPVGPFSDAAAFDALEELRHHTLSYASNPGVIGGTDYGNYERCGLHAYNAHEHPWLAENGRIVLSYNVGAWSFDFRTWDHDENPATPMVLIDGCSYNPANSPEDEDPMLGDELQRNVYNYRPQFYVTAVEE